MSSCDLSQDTLRFACLSRAVRGCEPLERRLLLCGLPMDQLIDPPAWSDELEFQHHGPDGGPEAVSIVWANRGQSSDNFASTFGTSATAARNVIDAAIRHWERVITNFNRDDSTTTLQVNISISGSGFGGAGAPAATAPSDGRPRTGSFTLGGGNVASPDPNPNDSNGWYFDASPDDWVEFDTPINAFSGSASTPVGSDFYSVAIAELTHVLGLVSDKTNDGGSWQGYRLESSGFATNTNVRDDAEGGGNWGHFWAFDGPTVDHLMTSFNSGDQTDQSWGNVVHSAGVRTNNLSFNGKEWQGSEDAGNAGNASSQRVLPSWAMAHVLGDAYGYTIADPEVFGTFYASPNVNNGTLTIRGGAGNSADLVTISTLTLAGSNFIRAQVDIGDDIAGTRHLSGPGNLPAWTSIFPASSVSQIIIEAGGGNDIIRIDNNDGKQVLIEAGTGNDFIDLGFGPRNLSLVTDFITIEGGADADTIFIYDNNNTGGRNVTFNGNSLQLSGSANLATSEVEAVVYNGGSGMDAVTVAALPANRPLTLELGSGSDSAIIGNSGASDLIRSPVNISGGAGDDIVTLAANAPLGVGVITAAVSFNGGSENDTLHIGSGLLDAVNAPVTFNGGTNIGGNGDRVFLNDTSTTVPWDYVITSTTVTRNPHFSGLTYSNTSDITLNCSDGSNSITIGSGISPIVRVNGNGGDDNFIVGGGLLAPLAGQALSGGAGTNQITFDDSLRTEARFWDVHPTQVIYGGIFVFSTTAFQAVGILAGNGADEITFNNNIDGKIVNVSGGGGDDDFLFRQARANSISVTGGAGHDYVNIDDRSIQANIEANEVHDNRIVRSTFSTSYTINYEGMEDIDFLLPSLQNFTSVYSTSSNIAPGFATEIRGGTIDDVVDVFTHDSAGNQTIRSILVLDPGAGPDTVNMAAGSSTAPTTYNFSNPFNSQTRISGVTTTGYIGISSTVERVNVGGGAGNDTFNFDSAKSGDEFAIFGGGGDDVMNFGNGNVQGDVTSLAAFWFYGQDGTDTFTFRNGASTIAQSYDRVADFVRMNDGWAYSLQLAVPDADRLVLQAGSQPDNFQIQSVATGSSLAIAGGAGHDRVNVGGGIGGLNAIAGRIDFDSGANFGSVQVAESGSLGRRLHLDATSLGAYPGDTLFGPGGSMHFNTLVDSVDIITWPAMVLLLGSGADTVYAQPLEFGQVLVAANDPAAAPGDSLHLALAAAQNYVVTANGPDGSVSSSNRRTLHWAGIDQPVTVDDVAPGVVEAELNLNGFGGAGDGTLRRQAVEVTFSEDVSPFISVDWLTLHNLTTGQDIPRTNVQLDYDVATFTARYTFPAYQHGALPDGNYTGTIRAGLPDSYGNALPSEVSFSFFFLQGDANHDRSVNLSDFGILRANFGGSDKTFSQGDFNYDGLVNLTDFGILRSKFGTFLPPPDGRTMFDGNDGGDDDDDGRLVA